MLPLCVPIMLKVVAKCHEWVSNTQELIFELSFQEFIYRVTWYTNFVRLLIFICRYFFNKTKFGNKMSIQWL